MIIGNVLITNVSVLIMSVMGIEIVQMVQMRIIAVTIPIHVPGENGSVLEQTIALQDGLFVMGFSTAMIFQMKILYSVKHGPVLMSGSSVMMENSAFIQVMFVIEALYNTARTNQMRCIVNTRHVQVTKLNVEIFFNAFK